MKVLLCFCYLFHFATTYSQKAIPDGTFPLSGGTFIYYPPDKALLLVGSGMVIPDSTRSNVWKWDGKGWSKIEAYGPGSIDFSNGTALNTQSNIIYSFGGYDMFDDPKEDTWSFDGKKWSKIITNNSIGNRIHHAMVYSEHLKAFVLYGGFDENRNDDTLTWLLKDGKFTALNISGPGTRHQFCMAYDKNRKKVVLYGGSERSDELWEFDGKKWTKIVSKEGPGNRMRHQMVYNDDLKMIILHGGDPRNSPTQSTWGWNGNSWTKIAEEEIFADALGYDANRKVVVAYGNSGNSDKGVWELRDGKWTKIADYGKWDHSGYRKKWMEEHPNDVMPLINNGLSFLYSRQFAEAEVIFKKLEPVFPQKISMLINLVYVLLMQNKSLEAEEYIAKVNKLGLPKRYSNIHLAGYLCGAKKYQEAVKYYEKALETLPKGSDFYNLACCYALTNNNDKAFEALNKAMEYGYSSKGKYENDTDLESLKSDARWNQLVVKLK